ncbi:MAG: response regulator [Dethiobacter sp.]|nr:response regulator [Dethiobacter sp.]MCL5982337.1 response regulator [Bacillota bacterium]
MLCSKSKIVIVDDSPLFRTYLKGLLASQYDLELIEINTAQELHSYLRNANIQDIALVLLDLNLPDGNGIEVIQKMKESPATRDLAVIIVSTYIDKDTALLAIKTGAQDLVVKPFKAEELLESIDKLFSSAPLVQQIYLRDQKEVKDYYQQINTEIKRARRANYQLTLLMTGFFRNGSLDSPTRGDDCRQNIALGSAFLQLLRESLRETDSVFSLSTHEYLLILPFTSAQGTATVLENMEQSFAKTLQHKGCVAMKMLTAMVSYPSDGGDFREIIAKLEARYKEQL